MVAPSAAATMSFRWESIGTFYPTEVVKASERMTGSADLVLDSGLMQQCCAHAAVAVIQCFHGFDSQTKSEAEITT